MVTCTYTYEGHGKRFGFILSVTKPPEGLSRHRPTHSPKVRPGLSVESALQEEDISRKIKCGDGVSKISYFLGILHVRI